MSQTHSKKNILEIPALQAELTNICFTSSFKTSCLTLQKNVLQNATLAALELARLTSWFRDFPQKYKNDKFSCKANLSILSS